MDRRKFLSNGIKATAGLGAATFGYAWQIEPFWLEIVKLQMPIENLPNKLVGKTLMQISDIHVGPRFDHQWIIDSFQKAAALNPDFVMYTGDYVSYRTPEQYNQLEEVLRHTVYGKLGTAAVLGNHDYGFDWSEIQVAIEIRSLLRQYQIDVLSNEQLNYQGLNIIGMDDFWGLNFDPKAAMNGYDSSKANLVLCHNPDVCDLDVWNHYRGWILAGHTHGGQCRLPFMGPPIVPVKNKDYTEGLFEFEDGRKLYINRALGHRYQVRFNVRPEITVFELVQG